ncbi:MAG: hypothetical protein V2A54_13250 [Bacteroidota bacterium]
MNSIFKIGIVGGLLYGFYKLMGMQNVSEKVVTNLSNPRVHTVDMRGLVIRTEIRVDNPTRSSVTITKPVITLTTKEKYITSTQPENKTVKIKPLSTTQIDTIEVIIPWRILAGYIVGLLGKIPQLIEAFKKKDMSAFGDALAIPLEMKYSLYANGLYYESEIQKIL